MIIYWSFVRIFLKCMVLMIKIWKIFSVIGILDCNLLKLKIVKFLIRVGVILNGLNGINFVYCGYVCIFIFFYDLFIMEIIIIILINVK